MPSLHTIARRLAAFPLAFAFAFIAVVGAEPASFADVRAADAQRIAATIARDTAALDPLLCDDLHYTNADGRVQTKSEYLASVARADARYISVEPQAVTLQSLGSDAVAMTGRTHVVAESAGQRVQFSLRFLAAWRREAGRWRLAAYQSTPLPASP